MASNDSDVDRLDHHDMHRRVILNQDHQASIWGRGVNKSYGLRKNKIRVLKDLNITVPRGCIYGLLGPSGCGKTTLLRCVLGRLHIDKGHIIVLGDRPGAKGHKIPGSMVGYMPQETALFPDLTISETLMYFGTLHGMTSEEIRARTDFLVHFLSLPEKNRCICQLSGGQMRRVSFSVALLHEPELLILDEPTVGVDPLLRERIWDHLVNITSHTHNQTTIILTTHYIEEARQANRVGFMRNGRILSEEDPLKVIEKYSSLSLESVFLRLCQEDKEGTPPGLAPPTDQSARCVVIQANAATADDDVPLLMSSVSTETLFHSGFFTLSIGLPKARNILAQFLKNLQLLRRNIGFLLFQFMLPIIQIVLFCICIGNDPFGLHIAVINEDPVMGKAFLQTLDNYTIIQEDFTQRGPIAAFDSVKQGKNWGILSIGSNFTQDLLVRFLHGGNISDAMIDGSSIKVQLDATNQQVAIILSQKITDAFETFARDLLAQQHINEKLASLPIEMLAPVYGSYNAKFTDFMAPGVIISITFFLATGLTTLVFVMDKKNGMLDRCLACGMISFEIMLAHMFTQMLIVVVQIATLLLFALFVFKVPCLGPLIWVVLLVFIEGFLGMALGVVYSAVCNDENAAIQLALGTFYPLILISGIIWPVEAMPVWLKYISYCSPLTYACEALRCVLGRGLDITFYAVWRGYLVSLGWCVGLVLLGGIILRVKE